MAFPSSLHLCHHRHFLTTSACPVSTYSSTQLRPDMSAPPPTVLARSRTQMSAWRALSAASPLVRRNSPKKTSLWSCFQGGGGGQELHSQLLRIFKCNVKYLLLLEKHLRWQSSPNLCKHKHKVSQGLILFRGKSLSLSHFLIFWQISGHKWL